MRFLIGLRHIVCVMEQALSRVSRAINTLRYAMCLLLTASIPMRADDATDTVAGMFACGGCATFIIGLIVLNVLLLVWVAKDAKARGMDNSVIWMLVVMFLGVLGLVLYLLARPQGVLTRCHRCSNKRMAAAVACPSCGVA